MQERTTQALLVAVGVLLLVHLFRPGPMLPTVPTEAAEQTLAVLRA